MVNCFKMKFSILTCLLLLPLAVSSFFLDNLLNPKKLVPIRPFRPVECMMCQFSVSLVNYALRTSRGADHINKFTNSFCVAAKIEAPSVCSNVTKLFNQEIVKVLSNGVVTPSQLCGFLSNNTCGQFHNPLEDWEVNLNVVTNLSPGEFEKMQYIKEERMKPAKPYRVIQISDTHVDLKYEEGTVMNCQEPLCCRANSSNSTSQNSYSGYWGAYSNCDIPLRTLESTLKAINASLSGNSDIDYIIWTGDIQPHDVWDQSKQTSMKTYDKVFRKIFEYLPDVKVYPTLGNHEMVPVDSFSPSNLLSIARDDSPEWLYRKIDSYWSRWLPKETVQTITKDGFYAATVRPGLKIISLNTNFCHSTNFWLYINSTDPGNQLQWLIHELQISEWENEQVHIIGHIPPGNNDCLKAWSKNFNKIVRRFHKTITGQFYGHTHNNEFEVFYNQDGSDNDTPLTPISIGFIGPSVTTFIGLNPSFRTYTVDPNQGFSLIDFETHYMNLTEANLNASFNKEPEWISSGPFTKLFGINDTSPVSMHSLLIEMANELRMEEGFKVKNTVTALDTAIHPFDPETMAYEFSETDENSKLYHFYRFSNSYSDVFGLNEFKKISRDEKRKFLCRLFTSQSHNFDVCERFISEMSSFNEISVF